MRACCLGNLDGRSAHAARSAQNQHGFTGLEGCAVYQRVVRGGINHDEGCGVHHSKSRWQRHAQGRARNRVATKAARATQAGHGLADLQVGDAFAHRLHDASVFRSRHKGQGGLHLVLVLHDQQVGKIQAGGLDFDQHFARFGRGGG